jgi:hypothetical protein
MNTMNTCTLIKTHLFLTRSGTDSAWERGKYSRWESKRHLGHCYNYALNITNIPSFMAVRFTDNHMTVLQNELKVSTSN